MDLMFKLLWSLDGFGPIFQYKVTYNKNLQIVRCVNNDKENDELIPTKKYPSGTSSKHHPYHHMLWSQKIRMRKTRTTPNMYTFSIRV